MNKRYLRRGLFLAAGFGTMALLVRSAAAQDAPTLQSLAEQAAAQARALDTVWVMFAAFLVFWMQAGFAYVEGGFTRAKNQNNILMKNLLDFCIGTVAFWAVGFALLFGAGNGFAGTTGFFLNAGADEAATYAGIAWANVPLMAKFMFQLVFAATAATIVSGAMAERTKFGAYLVYSLIISAVVYPISGHWIWGGGWLAERGFWDFAGSTVVHSVGGWVALAGAAIIGPRIGKYGKDGKVNAIPGHNIPMAGLGVFILWLGWFGFNPGSTMAASGTNYESIAYIAATTNIAAALGTLTSLALAWILFKKPDVSMALNGALAGLVGITAACPWVSLTSAAIIGACAGALVIGAILFFDRIRVDDPVGAISVHGVCGVFGTLAVGLFSQGDTFGTAGPKPGLFFGGGTEQLAAQAVGAGAVFLWATTMGVIVFGALKMLGFLRVTAREELEGLDIGEHGSDAYPDFVTNDTPHILTEGHPLPSGQPARKPVPQKAPQPVPEA